ncbi:MAG TPA: hypothetical protein VFT22_01140 [Kofleriaceae bacterium]|nr:hypothetical protein [Kofleriaceae bacterium]
MRSLLALGPLATCGLACGAPTPAPPAEPTTKSAGPWQTPERFRSETIPFPLDFAPAVAHRGFEELRFAPGFFDPAAPGYWSYAFVWRTEDDAALDAAALGAELTTYFRGLIDAVDEARAIADRDAIVVTAAAEPGSGGAGRLALAAHVFDAFKTKQPLDLVGWAERIPCGTGALWRFVLAPAASSLRPRLDGLARAAACDQVVSPPAQRPER